ncbi:LacI family DNA-binding transcriptional regulator [Kitasatospora sp. NPDC094015]|uniref:LacI family DNA-binding transcriptional regulator n=1 Tax=Kitasatospora sp. NPDC094015 TaxID=3155205 RepID=UPI00332A7A8F
MTDALQPTAARPATLEDVARVAGVSRSTVSRVVNGVRNVDPAIQETVRQAVAATGYVPNGAARALVTRRADTVALIVSGAGETGGDGMLFTDPFFGRVVGGVLCGLRPPGMHPVLMLADDDASRAQVIAYLRRGSADGALLVSTHGGDPLPALLAEAGLPAVLFGRPAAALPLSYVDLANHEGARLAADHLAARGCRRVVTVTGPADLPAGQDRQAGFREAMARHGRPWSPEAAGDFTRRGGAAAMTRLLAEHPDLDGVFAANDLMAQGVLAVLREHGRRVPEDVAVIGFDDSSAATAAHPRLTTVRQPVEEMATRMTTLLLDRIRHPGAAPTSVLFEPRLIIRDSA